MTSESSQEAPVSIPEQDTPGWKLYKRQVQFYIDRDMDGLVSTNYTEDASLTGFNFHVSGAPALKQAFTVYLDTIGDLTLKTTEKFIEGDDFVFFEAIIGTSKVGDLKVYDIFTLRDRKIPIISRESANGELRPICDAS